MQGHTLMRRIEIDLAQSTIPCAMRYIPGVMGAIAEEVEAGPSRPDECTRAWLAERRDAYLPAEGPVAADWEHRRSFLHLLVERPCEQRKSGSPLVSAQARRRR